MKKHIRTCQQCGNQQSTFSRVAICSSCTIKNKKEKLIANEEAELEDLGYKIVSGPTYDEHNHRKWKVITPCCNTEYEPLLLTVRSMMKRTGSPPCLRCGGKKRIAKAMSGYIAKYGASYNIKDKHDYVKCVRGLSNKTLDVYESFINPEKLNRGINDYHLDHRVPIIWCFKRGIYPELVALCTNLQMLSAEQNLKKGRSSSQNIDEALGLNVLNVLNYDNPVIDSGKLNLWPHQLKAPALSSMVLYRQNKCIRLSARSLELREVPPAIGKSFMNVSHLAGDVPATYRLGLWQDDKLLAMVSLGTSRFSKKYSYEILRFATAPGFAVSGACSRIFTHIRKNLDGKIVCYSDNQLGIGNVYSLAGLQYDGETGSGYFWEKDGAILQRYQTQKHKLKELLSAFDPNKTEAELMQYDGWRKIKTPGNKRWLL